MYCDRVWRPRIVRKRFLATVGEKVHHIQEYTSATNSVLCPVWEAVRRCPAGRHGETETLTVDAKLHVRRVRVDLLGIVDTHITPIEKGGWDAITV